MSTADAPSGILPSNVSETISRLSAKPGVKATMILDRTNNSVLQTNGSFLSFRSVDAPRATTTNETSSGKEDGVEEFAAMISSFVYSAGGLVHDLDSEDDVKLLRLRTKKYEFVIVPDAKYLLVVVHDTPAA